MKILLSVLAVTLVAFGGAAAGQASSYGNLLVQFVDEEGLVDYKSIRKHRDDMSHGPCPYFDALDQAFLAIRALHPNEVERLDTADQIAFWTNAYNAFVLKLVADNYPIKPSEGKSKYPANSIRQIPGAWEHKKFRALGRDVTLDEIEHKILRAECKDPRIHMALVNSAVSAPKLRREPYIGTQLDAQLDDQARKFFADLRKFHIDREAGEVWVSPIFDWFADDFLPDATKNYPRHIAQQKSLTAFASKYVSAEDAKYLQEGKYVVMYFEYDWTLNEQAK